MGDVSANAGAGQGPLAGIRIVEFASIGPAPFAVMLLSDLGAEVLRIERHGATWPDVPIVSRGRASMQLDLKHAVDRDVALEAIALADIVIEGFRPGVMERLGLGPDVAAARNARLIYGRVTGWGQQGPLAQMAGHDINYIGIAALLGLLSRDGEPPTAPLNFLGDYSAGSLYLVLGLMAALYERERSGKGQIVDTAIIDGSISMLAPVLGMAKAGLLDPDPAHSMLSGAAPYYRTYRCADGRFIAIGALEPAFRRALTDRLGWEEGAIDGDVTAVTRRLEALFVTRTRDAWTVLFAGSDACVSPVLTPDEAADHPHLVERKAFVGQGQDRQPNVAPRLSRTPGAIQGASDGVLRLAAWRGGGISAATATEPCNSLANKPNVR